MYFDEVKILQSHLGEFGLILVGHVRRTKVSCSSNNKDFILIAGVYSLWSEPDWHIGHF